MAEIDTSLGSDLIEGIRNLAVRYHGDESEASQQRVINAAVCMRILWVALVEGHGDDVEEPEIHWEFGEKQPTDESVPEICKWLFGRR